MIGRTILEKTKLDKRREPQNTGKKLVVASAGSLAFAYFFDPQLGRTRRAQVAGRIGGFFRRGARRVARKTEYAKGHAEGLKHLGSSGDRVPENDATLVDKIESEVLTRWNYPKGRINVNAADGVVELRGMCDTEEQIKELEAEVRKVTGVIDVHNYLHLPNTPPPNKEDALRAGS